MMRYIALFILILSIVVAGCTTDAVDEQPEDVIQEEASGQETVDIMDTDEVSDDTSSGESAEETDGDVGASATEADELGAESDELPVWMTTTYKDVNTQIMFTINQFKGTPVLVESFAVWCPTCTRQQNEIKKLHDEVGDDIISIALDTDPNEDESKVVEHTEQNGFDWRYAVSPTDATQSLIDQFGVGIVNAPSVPMVLVCPDQTVRQLPGGVKTVQQLKDEVAACG